MTEPDVRPATPSDEGLNMNMDQVLFDEPAPRKRRVSTRRNRTGRETAPRPDCVLPPPELGEGVLPVPVAQLWEAADVGGGNQTSHQDHTPVVRMFNMFGYTWNQKVKL